jgi:hypothetical protein
MELSAATNSYSVKFYVNKDHEMEEFGFDINSLAAGMRAWPPLNMAKK